MIIKEIEKGIVPILLEKGRELQMSQKEWEDLESLIVHCYGKKAIEIKNPPKSWSPCSGDDCWCKKDEEIYMKVDFSCSHIIGIIDSYDSVHSKIIHADNVLTHTDIWQNNIFKRWSCWDEGSGFQISPISSKFDVEDFDKIEQHLKCEYNIDIKN